MSGLSFTSTTSITTPIAVSSSSNCVVSYSYIASEFAAVLLTIIIDAFPSPSPLAVIFCADAFVEIWPTIATDYSPI
jgi:hypothetical protein